MCIVTGGSGSASCKTCRRQRPKAKLLARGFVRDAVAVRLTVNRLARRGVHEQLPSRSPRHSPSATSSCPPARLRVCTPTAPPPLQPVLPLGLGYSSPLDRELLRFRGGTAFHCAAPAWHGGHPARTYAINPTSSLQGRHSMRDTEATRLCRAEQGPALWMPWCACTQHLGWT